MVAQKPDRVGISIPVLVSGVPDGTVTIPDFLKVTLQTPSGARWTSAWQSISMNKFFPGERVASAQFTMPRAVYDEFLGKPLSVQITFALTQARAENVERFALGQDDFARSGVRICTAIRSFAERPDEIGGIACRAPLQPELTLAQARRGPVLHAAAHRRKLTTPCKPRLGSDRLKRHRWNLVSFLSGHRLSL